MTATDFIGFFYEGRLANTTIPPIVWAWTAPRNRNGAKLASRPFQVVGIPTLALVRRVFDEISFFVAPITVIAYRAVGASSHTRKTYQVLLVKRRFTDARIAWRDEVPSSITLGAWWGIFTNKAALLTIQALSPLPVEPILADAFAILRDEMLGSPASGAGLIIRTGLAASDAVVTAVRNLILTVNAATGGSIEIKASLGPTLEACLSIYTFSASNYALGTFISIKVVSVGAGLTSIWTAIAYHTTTTTGNAFLTCLIKILSFLALPFNNSISRLGRDNQIPTNPTQWNCCMLRGKRLNL